MGEGGLVVEEDEGRWEGEGKGGVIRGGRGVVGGFEEVEHFRAFYELKLGELKEMLEKRMDGGMRVS